MICPYDPRNRITHNTSINLDPGVGEIRIIGPFPADSILTELTVITTLSAGASSLITWYAGVSKSNAATEQNYLASIPLIDPTDFNMSNKHNIRSIMSRDAPHEFFLPCSHRFQTGAQWIILRLQNGATAVARAQVTATAWKHPPTTPPKTAGPTP